MKQRSYIRKILATTFLSLTICRLSAQNNYTAKNFNTENGLPQNSIIRMTMDYDGYLWMATQSGLIRYDGTNFKTFLFNRNNPTEQNDVQYLLNIQSEKKIIFGTANGLSYLIENGKPIRREDLKRSAYTHAINGYFPTLSFYKIFNSSIINHAAQQKWNVGVSNILPVNATDYIVGYENTQLLFFYKNGILTREIQVETKMESFVLIHGLYFLKDVHSNLYLYDSSSYKFRKINFDWAALHTSPAHLNEIAFYPDPFSQKTWCSYNSTFYLVDFSTTRNLITFIPQFSITDKSHFWRGVTYDSSSSTFFLSTLTEGIFQVKMKKIQTLDISEKLPKGLEAGSVINYSVLQTSDSTVVIPSGFKLTATAAGTTVQRLGNFFGHRDGIALLKDGSILCNSGNGLFYYSSKDGFNKKQPYNDSFNRYNILSSRILYPEADSIWLGAEDGLLCITRKNYRSILSNTKGDSLNYSNINLFYRINPHEAFISNRQGCYRVKTSAPYRADAIPELKGKQVRHISAYKNVLIFSVHRHGLYILKDNVFYKVPVSEGAEDISSCHTTYIDKNENIWVNTNSGLFKSTVSSVIESALTPGSTAFFYYFGKQDGIDNTEFNGAGSPSFAVLKKEQLFYPSMGGIVTFKPAELNNKIITAPPIVEKIWIDDKETDLLTDSIYLHADFKYLTIEVVASNFGEPRNLSLEYKLDTDEWKKIKAINNYRVILVDIPSGKHQLVIRKRTGFGSNDYSSTTLTIFKAKFIYEKWWFYPIIAILTTLLFFFFLRLNTQSLHKKRIQLQKKVDDQTSELSKTVEVKDLLINIISHDMATPLRHISFISEILSKGLEKNPERMNEALLDIKTTSDKILSGSLTMINWIKYNNKEIAINKKALHLYNLVNETFEIYASIAKTKGISLINNVPKSKFAEADYYILTTILNNLVSNAIKHTSKGEIKVSYEPSPTGTDSVLKITDTGSGMTEQILYIIREVLKGNLQVVKSTNKINTGLGYVMIAELIKIHGLSVSVESEPNKGTTVSLIINDIHI